MGWLELQARCELLVDLVGEVGQDAVGVHAERGGDDANDPGGEGGSGTPEGDEQLTARAGFRCYGKSKDHRDDLPQVVIGMAVTRTGIPVREPRSELG